MQTNVKDIYKLTAVRTGKSEQQYKEIGDFVFSTLYKFLRRPNTLIAKLKGIGSWYIRKKRIDTHVNLYPPDIKEFDETATKQQIFKYENRIEVYNIFKERMKDYNDYITERDKIRKKRYETQTILTSKEES